MGKFKGLFDTLEKDKQKTPAKRKAPAKKPQPAPVARRGRPSGSLGGKRSDPNYTQLIAYVKKETHSALKVALAPDGEISELVQQLLDDWLKKHK